MQQLKLSNQNKAAGMGLHRGILLQLSNGSTPTRDSSKGYSWRSGHHSDRGPPHCLLQVLRGKLSRQLAKPNTLQEDPLLPPCTAPLRSGTSGRPRLLISGERLELKQGRGYEVQ